jgi:hypothetical protein
MGIKTCSMLAVQLNEIAQHYRLRKSVDLEDQRIRYFQYCVAMELDISTFRNDVKYLIQLM